MKTTDDAFYQIVRDIRHSTILGQPQVSYALICWLTDQAKKTVDRLDEAATATDTRWQYGDEIYPHYGHEVGPGIRVHLFVKGEFSPRILGCAFTLGNRFGIGRMDLDDPISIAFFDAFENGVTKPPQRPVSEILLDEPTEPVATRSEENVLESTMDAVACASPLSSESPASI